MKFLSFHYNLNAKSNSVKLNSRAARKCKMEGVIFSCYRGGRKKFLFMNFSVLAIFTLRQVHVTNVCQIFIRRNPA